MKIGIVGLGYVGLPLACLFATKYEVIGFDINADKISLLQSGIDYTGEVGTAALQQTGLSFTCQSELLQSCNVIIVAVPTDITSQNQPDLAPLQKASATIGAILQPGITVVFESTVYPGLTEEVCIPVLESVSGLQWKKDFFVGYSPERINPGDKKRPLHAILKIVSGDTPQTLALLSELYGAVIQAGIYQAPDIRTAEAAKVIENAQRDLNIAFMNELSLIFDRMQLDTREVLKAAGTKWNFLPFEPGLVGGHCIGVDPYYLTFKAEQLGYSPQVIHSGRHVNNAMGQFIADKIVKLLIRQKKVVASCKVLVMGCSFKENVGDVRNSKVFDIIDGLHAYHVETVITDPAVDGEALHKKGYSITPTIPADEQFDAVVLAVKHEQFKNYDLSFLQSKAMDGQLNLFDVKAFYDRAAAEKLCTYYWRL
ncbi:MAG: nucleotide sugar dehydrogenase [Bacteroidota bacterium]|nr:nucleotide sugar dehydrogenase [Bacteroidota bacterium]